MKANNVKVLIMQLTQFTDYALRVLIYVAVHKEKCTIAQIAQAYDISENHLVKIVHKLGKEGILETVRGKHGGIFLAQAPESLNLKDLVLLLEPNFHVVGCFDQINANCRIIPVCKLKGVLADALQQFMDVLAQYTLADMVQNQQELREIFQESKK